MTLVVWVMVKQCRGAATRRAVGLDYVFGEVLSNILLTDFCQVNSGDQGAAAESVIDCHKQISVTKN